MSHPHLCWADLRWPHDLLLLVRTLLYNTPTSMCETGDLLLNNRRWQRWWYVTPMITPLPLFKSLSSLQTCSRDSKGADSEEASYHIVHWLCREAHVARNWGWPGEATDLRPTAARNWILPTTMQVLIGPQGSEETEVLVDISNWP